ncbi:MAG TPA: hypothetical protein VIL51_01340 [Thermoleophilia bacterium]
MTSLTSAADQDPSGYDEWATKTSKHRITLQRSLETTRRFGLRFGRRPQVALLRTWDTFPLCLCQL